MGFQISKNINGDCVNKKFTGCSSRFKISTYVPYIFWWRVRTWASKTFGAKQQLDASCSHHFLTFPRSLLPLLDFELEPILSPLSSFVVFEHCQLSSDSPELLCRNTGFSLPSSLGVFFVKQYVGDSGLFFFSFFTSVCSGSCSRCLFACSSIKLHQSLLVALQMFCLLVWAQRLRSAPLLSMRSRF